MNNANLVIPSEIEFTCNVCGSENKLLKDAFHRELAFCKQCKSNARFRGIVHALSMSLYNKSICLLEFPEKDIPAIGMSDWDGYAKVLAKKFNYKNTYYDREPFLDIAGDTWKKFVDLKFIISTDVFEHVLHPVSLAFENAYKMLAEGGVLILSVPYHAGLKTIEHYPSLHKFQIVDFLGEKILVNRTSEGRIEVYDDLVFHGGQGSTLEMRVFSKHDVIALLSLAGFDSIKVYEKPILEIGYYWPPLQERVNEIGFPLQGHIIAATKS